MFVIPIETLHLPGVWRVGRTSIHPGETFDTWLEDAPPHVFPDGSVSPFFTEAADRARAGSFAVVPDVPTVEEALDAVRASLDALRLFQQLLSQFQDDCFRPAR